MADPAEQKDGLRILKRDDVSDMTIEIGKASTISIDGEMAQRSKEPQDEQANVFKDAGALPPPYDPETLCRVFENSSTLRQNVDAYVTNIDAFGHRLEPIIDLESDSALEEIRAAMFAEALHENGETEADESEDGNVPEPPSEEEVKARMKEIAILMLVEKSRVSRFFDFVNPEMSFITIRRRLRQDMEVMGNGYLEVLRNKMGAIAQLIYVPGFTMRLMPMDRNVTEFDAKVKVSDIHFAKVPTKKRFRRYVQVFQNSTTFFKELGDPRTISTKTGKAYKDADELKRQEDESVLPATEIMHFEVHSPSGAYGVPRWIGNLLAVLGTRQSEEVNFMLFENKAVPPMAILVSGGRLASGVVAKIKEHLENLKGKASFHSVLVIEAVPVSVAQRL